VHSLVLVAPAANQDSLETVDRWLAAPVIGHLASAATLSVAGAVLNAGPLRRRIAGLLSLDDDRYLQSAARRLLTPAAWRSFVLEQRVLIQDLPVLERRLDRITVPTRIVTGSRDAVVPIRSLHRLVRQIPAAELIVLEGAGHLLPLRDADALAEIIRRAG
jgi:pimeloyl-ACP methyl ester carboxylesterase